jgi:DNA polymerase I
MMDMPGLELLKYWITERLAVTNRRALGEVVPGPEADKYPYSADPIFRRKRFCHVEREHDAVTIWLRDNWRDPYRDDPDVWFLMAVARLGGNEPKTLSQITVPLPWARERYLAEFAAKGLKVGRRGYRPIISPSGPNHIHVAHNVFDLLWAKREWVRPKPGDSCRSFQERLLTFKGIGGFLAGQVVADVKFTGPLRDAQDRWTFAVSGEGSRPGLNVVLGRAPESPWDEEDWLAAFKVVHAAIKPWLAERNLNLSASDVQSCLCEVSKLAKHQRALATGKTAPKQRAAPKPTPTPPPASVHPALLALAAAARVGQAAPAARPVTGDHSKFRYLARPFICPASGNKPDGLRAVVDIEADGLLGTVRSIHCIVIGDLDSDQVDEYGPEQIDDALAHLARAAVLVGHNIASYDLEILRRLRGWTPPAGCKILDTLIAGRTILPNLEDLDDQATAMGDPPLGKLRGRYSLEAWGIRLDHPKTGTEIEDWSRWTPEMQARCVGDVALCKKLFHFLNSDDYSQEALALEHRVAAICARITSDGAPFDREAALQLQEQWTARRADLARRLALQFPGTKLSSPTQIAKLLEARGWVPDQRTEKTGRPKIDDALLETIPATYPEFAGLAEHHIISRRLAQLYSGKQAWCRQVGDDGRIHGGLLHIGTPHSRARHFKPNLAQVPNPKKGKPFATECRSLFRDPEWVFVTADQAGLQDRSFAHDLAPFDNGAYAATFAAKGTSDIHWQTSIALGLAAPGTVRDKANKVHEAIREGGGKRFRYAFLFGVGAATAGRIICDASRAAAAIDPNSDLQQRLFGGAVHPNQEALTRVGKQALNRFETATPGLRRLRESLQAHIRQHGWLPGLDGRRVPVRALYTALNYSVTSSEAIICKRWLVRVYDELCSRFRYGWDGDVVIALWVHDEIAVACRPEIAEQVGEILVRHASEPGEYYHFRVPLEADYKIGASWAGEPPGATIITPAPMIAAPPLVDVPAGNPIEIAEPESEPIAAAPAAIQVEPGFTVKPAPPPSFEQLRAAYEQATPGQANGKGNGHAEYDAAGAYTGSSDGPAGNGHGERDTGQQVAFFVYRHADGRNYLGVKKTTTKQFPQFHWTGTAWVPGAPAGLKIPYRLPELIKAPPDQWVLICAGEKDADSAAALGFTATTNPEGERKNAGFRN